MQRRAGEDRDEHDEQPGSEERAGRSQDDDEDRDRQCTDRRRPLHERLVHAEDATHRRVGDDALGHRLDADVHELPADARDAEQDERQSELRADADEGHRATEDGRRGEDRQPETSPTHQGDRQGPADQQAQPGRRPDEPDATVTQPEDVEREHGVEDVEGARQQGRGGEDRHDAAEPRIRRRSR